DVHSLSYRPQVTLLLVSPVASYKLQVASSRPKLPPVSPRPPWRRHPRQEPDAVMPHVRICGGGRGQPRSLLRPPRRPPAPVARHLRPLAAGEVRVTGRAECSGRDRKPAGSIRRRTPDAAAM